MFLHHSASLHANARTLFFQKMFPRSVFWWWWWKLLCNISLQYLLSSLQKCLTELRSRDCESHSIQFISFSVSSSHSVSPRTLWMRTSSPWNRLLSNRDWKTSVSAQIWDSREWRFMSTTKGTTCKWGKMDTIRNKSDLYNANWACVYMSLL